MRRFIYQYNGNERFQDFDDDLTGGRETPAIGSVMSRNGREWKVVRVVAPVSSNGTVPVVRVFLNDPARSRVHPHVKFLPK
jgi:hypothetical protein